MTIDPIEIITGDTTYPSPFTHRVMIVCEEKGIPYTLTQIDTENKPDWFLAIAPLGLIPVMRIGDEVIPDSHEICEYLDKLSQPSLLSDDTTQPFWLLFTETLSDEIARVVKEGNIRSADLTELDKLLEIFNDHCTRPFFYGDKLSLVDIYLISHLLWLDALEQKVLPSSLIKKYSNVNNWLSIMKQRASVNKTMGENYANEFVALLKRYQLV